MIDEPKAAQMAAYFLDKQDGRMPVLKLMKLMYLADRASLGKHGHPITFDRMVSMDHGPVLSSCYNLAAGASQSDGWEHWISAREDNDVALRRKVHRDDLQDLSDADVEVLKEVWGKFGHLGKWQIRDYTHQLPEWRDPEGSSLPLPYEDVFNALGIDAALAKGMAEHLRTMNALGRKLAR